MLLMRNLIASSNRLRKAISHKYTQAHAKNKCYA
jgi:hypothetical protein